jgi:hypothetical protein
VSGVAFVCSSVLIGDFVVKSVLLYAYLVSCIL